MIYNFLAEVLVIAFIIGTYGEKLSELENEQIQQICGSYNKMRNKVLYGTRTIPSQAPWAVPIAVYRKEGVMYCTGTLVSSRHVITARHCFIRDFSEKKGFIYVFNEERVDFSSCNGPDFLVPAEISEADLHFGTECRDGEACKAIRLSPNLITRKTSKVVLPGLCASRSRNVDNQDDFALIELDRDVLFSEKIHPVCISRNVNGLLYGANVTIYGFGYDPADKQTSTGVLRYESSSISRCQYRTEKYVCSISYNGYQLACRGDSGGGVIFKEQNKNYLVAVLSRGEACRLNAERYIGDILAPVRIYLDPICRHTGICKITNKIKTQDVGHLYGYESARSSNSRIGEVIEFTIVCTLSLMFSIR